MTPLALKVSWKRGRSFLWILFFPIQFTGKMCFKIWEHLTYTAGVHLMSTFMLFYFQYTSLRIWRFLLRDAMGAQQRQTMLIFLDVLARIHNETFRKEQIGQLELDTNMAFKTCQLFISSLTIYECYQTS